MKVIQIVPVAAALCCGFASTGCIAVVGAGAAASGVAYAHNKAKAIEGASVSRVYSASLAAMRKMELDVTEKAKDGLGATIVATNIEGQRIQIRLKKIAKETTEISVMVGIVGNRHRSDLVLEAIRDNL